MLHPRFKLITQSKLIIIDKTPASDSDIEDSARETVLNQQLISHNHNIKFPSLLSSINLKKRRV